MRFLSLAAVAAVLACLGACAQAYEDGHLSRAINKQRAARDKCLADQVASIDDRSSTPETVGVQAASACSEDNDKLIQLVSTMDRGNEVKVTLVMRKDATMKATSYVLAARNYPAK